MFGGMVKLFKYKIIQSLAVIISVGTSIFAFQNCGKAGFDGALDAETLGAVDQAVAGAPFAFKAGIDQIAYNSCAGTNLSQKRSFFSLKFGAYYDGSGVSIRRDILDYANYNLKPVYPNQTVIKSQVKTLMASSPANKNMTLQASIRPLGRLSDVLLDSGRTAISPNLDVLFLLSNLVDDRWMDPLVPQEVYNSTIDLPLVNYFNHSPLVANSRIEGKFSVYNKDYYSTSKLRETMSMESYGIVLGFSDPAKELAVVSGLSSDYTRADASGYAFTFDYPSNSYPKNSQNILRAIREVNLTNGEVESDQRWDCSTEVMIVRPADAAANCPKNNVSEFDYSEAIRQRLVIIKNSLPGDLWEVNYNTTRGAFCAVPKESGDTCYSTSIYNTPLDVEYNPGNICFEGHFVSEGANDPVDPKIITEYDLEGFSNAQTGISTAFNFVSANPVGNKVQWKLRTTGQILPVKQCAQYVSICKRNP